MIKILLIEPKKELSKETTLKTHYEYPHLGLLSIASNLEAQGHKVDYFFTNLYKNPFEELKKILKKKYNYVGMSCVTETIGWQLKLAEFIKKHSKKTKIVLGGVQVWFNPKKILKTKAVDYIIRGLGELPFVKLVKNKNLKQIKGLCYKTKSKIIIKKPYIPNQKELQTTQSILKYSKYEKIYNNIKTFRNVRHLFTSFGCTFNCNFCSVPKLYNKRMIFRPINTIIDEVKYLSQKTRRIMFVDPDLNVNKKHFIKLFTRILDEKKKGNINKNVKFIIQARLDCFDEEMLTLAKKSNIIALIGIESLSQKIRDKDLNKGGKLAKMDKKILIKEIKRIGKYLKLYLYFILATPETKVKDLKDNLKYIKNLKKGWYEINIYITPFPETNYYDKYKDTKFITWNNIKINKRTIKIPEFLLCKDKRVVKYINNATEKASKKFKKNQNLSFSNLLLRELIKKIK